MLKGWNTILLGPSPASGSIESTIKELKPEKVILSAMTSIPFERDTQLISHLDHFASGNKAKFYLGGPGVKHLPRNANLQFIQVTDSLEKVLN